MVNISLSQNEGIITQYEGVYHNHKRSYIYLTNLNLICAEENVGLFKTTYNILKFPTNQIKVVNNIAQAFPVKDDYNWILQVFFNAGEERFSFNADFFDSKKKKNEVDKWVNEINKLLTGQSVKSTHSPSFFEEVKNIFSPVGVKHTETKSENTTEKCIGCMAPLSGEKGQIVICKYCDTEQTL